MPTTMPCVNAPHSGISAMHMPRAKIIPPTVLITSVTKSFFCIITTASIEILFWFLGSLLLTGIY